MGILFSSTYNDSMGNNKAAVGLPMATPKDSCRTGTEKQMSCLLCLVDYMYPKRDT